MPPSTCSSVTVAGEVLVALRANRQGQKGLSDTPRSPLPCLSTSSDFTFLCHCKESVASSRELEASQWTISFGKTQPGGGGLRPLDLASSQSEKKQTE
mmetsp:Transcript_32974/g.53337  ORF Transcript_32974/g.53337 Transcript_32974/m.53337 type:complete len:98 (+) Transcript_32974:477-770(+)